MTAMRVSCLLTALFLGIPSPTTSALAQGAPAQADDDLTPRTRRMEDGRNLLSFKIIPAKENDYFEFRAIFDFGKTKGLGRDDKPLANEDKSLIAVTSFPATKTSYVHLFIRQPNGDLTVVNTINLRAAKLLTGRWADAAAYRLEASSITGRVMQLSVFDYVRGNEAEEFKLKVSVGRDGTLTLVQ